MSQCETCQAQFDDHEKRLTDVERRQDAQGSKLDAIGRDVIAVRAEGNARAAMAQASMDRLSKDLTDMTRQLAEHTGAQRKQNQLAEDSLRRWRKISVVIGIVATLGAAAGSTLLSDQEIASTIWVKWLHFREPWDKNTE